MSFLIRSRNSQKWGRSGTTSAATSFSVRTGRRTSGESDSVVLRSGPQEGVRDCLAAAHFLRNETQAARTAVEALDRYILKLASFQDKAMELIEEAHRALSRLERAVSLSAAPELIVVACEIKVACHRGLHLFRTYGKYRYLGKLVALATHSSITAKFDAVIGRLTAIMPLDRSPSFTSVKAAAAASWAAGAATQRSSVTSQDGGMPDDAGQAQQQLQPPPPQQQQLASIDTASNSTAAGASAQRLKVGSMHSSADATVGSITQHEGAGAVLSVVLRSSEAGKVTCMSFVDAQGASTCIWWAAGDRLEFYSTSTQSTTSFAPHTERAAITALAVDNVGNIWCANSKGAVMMRQQRNWEQVFVERAFGSCVRCLAADNDSDVVWAGDEAGRLAVFRFVDEGGACKLECTATILPGRAGAGVKASKSSAQLDIKPKSLSRWQALSCRALKDQHKVAEGPIRTMLVRDDRAWVGGGRTDPWIGLFDAVLGTQLDMWSCGPYGSCLAMTSMLTSDAIAETHTAAATAALKRAQQPRAPADSGLDVPTSVPEDHIGEDPRSSWRLVTGHESGQLLLWNAAADQLQPVIRVGEAGLSPVKSLCVMEEQGLLAVVHANGDLAVFMRPMRDRDWLLGPTTTAAAADSAGAAAAAGAALGGGVSCSSNSGSAAGSTPGDTMSHALSSGPPVPHGERARSGGGGPNGAGLTTIKPRRVVLHSHRSMLVATAACSSGVVTASALGSIKLWPAEGLGREAERCGLLPTALQMQRASSLSTRKLGSNSRPQQLVSRQHSDSLVSNAHSPLEQQQGERGVSTPAYDPAAMAAGGAAAAAVAQLPSQHPSSSGGQQSAPLTLLDYQQQLSDRQGLLPAWAQPPIHPQDSMSHPHHQLYALPAHLQPQQQQQPLPDPVGFPNLARLSDPGVQWLQQAQQQQQQQPGLFMAAPRSTLSGVLPEQLANPLILQQQAPLERRSAPLDVPWQTGMVSPTSAAAAAAAGRSAGMGTAMYARMTAQHQLGQLGGSPRFSGALGAESLVGSVGAASTGGSLLGPDSLTGGFTAVPPGAQPVHDVPVDSGARYAAPRAPKALREREAGLNRERRRSERRLSKGAMVAWATCQIINASELRMLECIGGGAYGQVFLAEWMGTQVAAKQLLSVQNKAKDEVVKRKAKERAAQPDSDSDDASDNDSDTNSVDSVEEEVAAELKQLMDEVWVLGSLSHPSITRFCALCLDPPMIVMQYYPHGSLFDLLRRGRRGEKRALHELTWAKRLDMLRDIASGMVFLHSRKPPIVHGDLRSPNLLLDLTIDRDSPRFHVKIADFGLARMVGPTSSIAVSKVTNPRWSAPEVLRNSVVSLSADVFSFAVVMWELLTWAQPWEEMMSIQVLFSVMQNHRLEVPADEDLPGKPGPTLGRYVSLMERCWAEDEHARPTFEEVLLELDDLRTCELGHARLRGGDTQRSLQGSTRVSYSEAPGTPTGSCLGGTPLVTSTPGSNISSAPNSDRETSPFALAAAAAAGAAAASAAAAAAVAQRQSVDDSAVPYGTLQQQQQQQLGAGLGQGWRGFAGSAPGTPTGTGAVGTAGAAVAAAGYTQGGLLVGSAPTRGNSFSSGGSSKSGSSSAPHQAEPGGSPGPLPLPNSELSFAMRPAPGLSGPGAAAGMSGAGGTTSANVPARTPSRLGPTRCSSTISSPTAASGMAPRHEFEPVLLEHGASGDAAALGGRGGGLGYQRCNSGGVGASGVLVGSPQQQQQQQHLQAQPSQQQQLQLAHMGSRLRRLSWGTLEGSLQSSSSKQLGLQASRASWGGSLVHEISPAASPVAGERPCSPFAQAAHGLDATPGSPRSPFSKVVQQQQQQGGFSPRPARATQAVAAAAAAHASAVASGMRPSPFAASQLGGDVQGKGDTAGGSVAPAAAAKLGAPCRALSPFAAAQEPVAEAGAATCQAAHTVSATQSPSKPYDPFAAEQQLNSSPRARRSLQGSPASRQGTDDSTVAAPQPPAHPTSPFAAVQASVPEEGLPVEPSGFAPGAASAANAACGLSASQAVPGAAPNAAAAAAAAVPSRLSVDAARPASPFAAVQQVHSAGSDPPHVHGQHTAAGARDNRVASMTSSAFASATHSLLAFASSGGSSKGSCSAGGGSATHGPSRLGGAAYAGSASPFAAAAANGGTAAGAWQPNDPQVLGELQQLLLQQQQQQQESSQAQPQPGEQQGRASPFASVQAAAVQGPIVAQQAKAVLSRLNSQAGVPEPQPSSQQELQSPAVARGLDAVGLNADIPVNNTGGSGGGGQRPFAVAAATAATAATAAAADSDEPLAPLPSFAAASGPAGHQPHTLVHRGSSGAATAAAGSPGGQGSPICSGEFAVSGDSITFPSGLGAVESVVFMRGSHKPHAPPHPRQ